MYHFKTIWIMKSSKNQEKKRGIDFPTRLWPAFGLVLALSLLSLWAYGQDGNAGINEANLKVRSYFDSGTQLMYAVGALLGLIGAVKVYQKWNAGDPDTGKVAAAWFGSCVFLVVVATVIKSFFGV